ncbi:MAG: hypothetical protein MUE85_21445 [Microscillaceae bacterium]|jgi:hypothetical protein|nr:hypothetical protein [Microscillaceae bacterium]
MKYWILLSMIFCSSAGWRINAQNQNQALRQERYGSYGIYSTQQIAPGLGFTSTASFLQMVKEQSNLEKQLFGPLIFGYKIHLGGKISIGLQVSYTYLKTFINRTSSQEYEGRDAYLTLMPEIDYTHFDFRVARIYSGIAGGIAFLGSRYQVEPQADKIRRSMSGFAYQIKLLGARLNITNRIGVYGEVGFGYNGVFTLGVSERF